MAPHALDDQAAVAADLLSIAAEKTAAGLLDRRSFLRVAAALGCVPAVGLAGMGSAKAATNEFVVVNFGGPAVNAFKTAFGPAFEAKTGLKMVIDGSGPLTSKIRSMVDSRTVTWDACDTSTSSSLLLGNAGYLEPIDYAVVDKAKIVPGFALPFGVANYTYTYVLAYAKDRLSEAPKTWADFWDRKKFPGKRTMSKMPGGQLEAAVMAAGVPREKVYPIDVDLALKKIREIKDDVIFWDSGAQSQQLFRDHDVVMGNVWHTRAALLLDEMKDAFTWSWTDGILNASAWNVPRGNPAGRAAAMQFIASTQDPGQQVELFKLMANGPANPAAAALIPAELRFRDPLQPDTLKQLITSDAQWWSENNDRIADKWLDAISS